MELCELVELHSIQIACFELFSSIPENFNISVSERYIITDCHTSFDAVEKMLSTKFQECFFHGNSICEGMKMLFLTV